MNSRKRNLANMASSAPESSRRKKPRLTPSSHSSSQKPVAPSIDETTPDETMKDSAAPDDSKLRELAELFAAEDDPLLSHSAENSTFKEKKPRKKSKPKSHGDPLYSLQRYVEQYKSGKRFEAKNIKKKLGEIPSYLLAWHNICVQLWPEEIQLPWLYLSRVTDCLKDKKDLPKTYKSHNLDPNDTPSSLFYDHTFNKFGLLCKQHFDEKHTPFSGIKSVRKLWNEVEGTPILVGYDIQEVNKEPTEACKADVLYITIESNNSYSYVILKPGSKNDFFTGNLDSIVRPSESKKLTELLPRILELTAGRGHTAVYPFLPDTENSPLTFKMITKCQTLTTNEALAIKINQNPSQWQEILLGKMTDTVSMEVDSNEMSFQTPEMLTTAQLEEQVKRLELLKKHKELMAELKLEPKIQQQPSLSLTAPPLSSATHAPFSMPNASSSAYITQAISKNAPVSAHSHSHSSSHSSSSPMTANIPKSPSSPSKRGVFQPEYSSLQQKQKPQQGTSALKNK